MYGIPITKPLSRLNLKTIKVNCMGIYQNSAKELSKTYIGKISKRYMIYCQNIHILLGVFPVQTFLKILSGIIQRSHDHESDKDIIEKPVPAFVRYFTEDRYSFENHNPPTRIFFFQDPRGITTTIRQQWSIPLCEIKINRKHVSNPSIFLQGNWNVTRNW